MSPAPAEAAAAPFGPFSVGQIAITITNLERALVFYRDALGLKLLFEVPGLAFFDCAGIRLMLSGAEKPGESYSSVLYFRVPDIVAAALGVRIRPSTTAEARQAARQCLCRGHRLPRAARHRQSHVTRAGAGVQLGPTAREYFHCGAYSDTIGPWITNRT